MRELTRGMNEAQSLDEFVSATIFGSVPAQNDNKPLRYRGICRECGMPWDSNDPDTLCECKGAIEFVDTHLDNTPPVT